MGTLVETFAEAKIDVNTTDYRPILKFNLDCILSNEIPSVNSFPFLKMNWAVPFFFLQRYSVVVVMLPPLTNSYCLS